MEDFNEDIPSYEDISASLEAHSSAKYTGSSGDILSGGGRHSYEYYPKYLLDSLEAECAARQGLTYNNSNRSGWGFKKDRAKKQGKNPYINTTIKPAESRAKIYKLLNFYGAMDILFSDKGFVVFRLKAGAKILTIRKILPPIKNEMVGWRYIFWNLKSSVEALDANMTTIEEEFLQDTMIQLKSGAWTTIGEASKKAFLSLPSGI